MLPRRGPRSYLLVLLPSLLFMQAAAAGATESRCFGTVSKGRLAGGVKLPESGANFAAYNKLGVAAGRTYLHSRAAAVVVAAYSALAVADPSISYVYGETGLASGGRMRPHRTHQNGLSIDFFVPVRSASGVSVPLPTGIGKRFGYDIEFDAAANYGEYAIDFPAMAEHLYQLHIAAENQGIGIAQVIFETTFLPKLLATPRGAYLRQQVHFMQRQPWVRHDEHYHVDFKLPCAPLSL
jgi:penicillin-insensitive murein DD-endopeptidase